MAASSAPLLTAPTLSAVQEANLETYKQVYEALDVRLFELNAAFNQGRLSKPDLNSANVEVKNLMKAVSDKANALTGCPFGIWLDNQ
jgi:hypothetical protein